MSVYSDIGAAGAQADLAIARAMGTTIQFSRDGADWVELSVIVQEQHMGISGSPDKSFVEIGKLVLDIPVQSGLSVQVGDYKPILDNDRVLFLGRLFRVKYPIEARCNGYVFRVELVEPEYQVITHWVFNGYDNYGQPLYDDEVEFEGRWDDVVEEYVSPAGTQLVSHAKVYVPSSVTVSVLDVLLLGSSTGVVVPPKDNPGAYEVKRVDQLLRNTDTLTTVYL